MLMKVLLDAGAFIHSEFAEFTVEEVPLRWGNREFELPVSRLKRKQPHQDKDYQKQMDALFTVGRLIREEKIEAYTSVEIEFEHLRGTSKIQQFNALQGCKVHRCDPPLDRSRFWQTTDFNGFMLKGGKKDRRSGAPVGEETQIAFLEWLCTLDKERINALITVAPPLRLSHFQVDSLGNLDWFQFVCRRSGSAENYLDVFHLWTAERHGLRALLTLETGLLNIVSNIRSEKRSGIAISTEVLRPLDLLRKLGISEPDPVPIDSDRFYNLH